MWTGDVVARKANGERGRIEAVYPAHDGTTVVFRSMQALGVEEIDLPRGDKLEEHFILLGSP